MPSRPGLPTLLALCSLMTSAGAAKVDPSMLEVSEQSCGAEYSTGQAAFKVPVLMHGVFRGTLQAGELNAGAGYSGPVTVEGSF